MLPLWERVERVTRLTGFPGWVGMQPVRVEPGRVEFELVRRPELAQFHGYFHGGVIAALADHAAGAAASTLFEDGRIGVTVSMSLSFLAPADGERLIARARRVGGGSTLSVASVDVFVLCDGQEHLCAVATATLRAVPAPAVLATP